MRPDERLRFRSNAERWLQMPPEEQRILRERERLRRERVRREADAALRQSGLDLEAERRAQYERQYLQERQRIEQALRQELEEKRRRELAPVVERLKREFSDRADSAATAPSASAAPSAKSPK
jgi:predicted metal-dependent hydrolase